jgi:hypothetical protein
VNRPVYYKLIGRLPVPCANPAEWALAFGEADPRVAYTGVAPLHVSTLFIWLDYSWGDRPPLLFETKIFDDDDDDDAYQTRCSTWDEAETQHAEAVAIATERVRCSAEVLTALETVRQAASRLPGASSLTVRAPTQPKRPESDVIPRKKRGAEAPHYAGF